MNFKVLGSQDLLDDSLSDILPTAIGNDCCFRLLMVVVTFLMRVLDCYRADDHQVLLTGE